MSNGERRAEMIQLEADVKSVQKDLVNHEAVCAMRYKNIHTSIDTLNEDMKLIFGRLWKTAISVILLLLSIAGYLYVENKVLEHNQIQEQVNGQK